MSTNEVQIPNIELEIAKLSAEGQKKGEIHACLFNLIIYSQNIHRAAFLKEVIQAITETFPCRIMVIECDQETKIQQLKVNVEHEVVKKDGSAITCDRINIKCSANFLNRVPYILLPHLVPDLPVYLLWGQDPSQENEILPYLQTFASRLIFDSDSSNDLCAFCRKMLSDRHLAKLHVTDLNWSSLTSWRKILYQVFDSEEKIQQLRTSREILIRYNSRASDVYQHTERRSIYLQGWLASQLNWKFISSSRERNRIILTYHNGVGETKIILEGKSTDELIPGSIVGIEISTIDDYQYFLTRKGLQPFVVAHISSKTSCALPVTFPLQHSQKAPSFIKEMLFVPCTGHYWNMLRAIEPLKI